MASRRAHVLHPLEAVLAEYVKHYNAHGPAALSA